MLSCSIAKCLPWHADSGNTLELERKQKPSHVARPSKTQWPHRRTNEPRKRAGWPISARSQRQQKGCPTRAAFARAATLHSAERTSRARTHADASLPTRRQQPSAILRNGRGLQVPRGRRRAAAADADARRRQQTKVNHRRRRRRRRPRARGDAEIGECLRRGARFRSSKLSWRTRIADYLRINPFAYSAFNTICSARHLVVSGEHGVRYEESLWENRLDMFLSLWFFLVYCFEVWLAHDRLYHCVKYETVCDFLSVLPGVQHLGLKYSERVLFFRAFRCLRSLRMIRSWASGRRA